MSYPKKKYHKEYGCVRITSKGEEEALGDSWSDSYSVIDPPWDESNRKLMRAKTFRQVAEEMNQSLVKKATPDLTIKEPVEAESEAKESGFEAMSIDELRALASERGVKVHWKAGKEKIINALKDAEEE